MVIARTEQCKLAIQISSCSCVYPYPEWNGGDLFTTLLDDYTLITAGNH